MPEKRYTKVEEEILQILDKMEVIDERPARPPLRVVRSPGRKPRFERLRRVAYAPWLSLALTGLFAFLAIMLKDESHLAATILASCSILAFLSPIVIRRPGSSSAAPQQYGTKLWRGRDISLDEPHSDPPPGRTRRWFDRHRGGGP
jgi:hypothetical protein